MYGWSQTFTACCPVPSSSCDVTRKTSQLHLILEVLLKASPGRSKLLFVEVLECELGNLAFAFEKWICCCIKTTCIDTQACIPILQRVYPGLECRLFHAKVYQYCDVRKTMIVRSNA